MFWTKQRLTVAVLVAVGLSSAGFVTVADRIHAGNQPAKPSQILAVVAPKAAPADDTRTMVSTKEPVRIDQQEAVQKIVCSQDGALLAIGTRTTLRVLEIPTAKERFEFTDMEFLQGFALAPNGKTLAVMEGMYYGQGRVRFWQVDHYKPSPIFEKDALPDSLVFSPDSKTLICWGRSSSNTNGHLKKQGSIILWEAATRKKLREFEVSDVDMLGGYKCFGQSPDGKKLAIGAIPEVFVEGFVANRDKQQKDLLKQGVILAGPRGNPFVRIWEMETGKEIVQIKHHPFGATDFVFASGGQTLITVGCLQEICDVSGKNQIKVQGARIIDNKWFAGENSIVLSDATTGKEIRRFAEKRSEKLIFRHIALSADGKTLAGGGSDGVIYLWDVATGKEIQQLKNHQADLAQIDGWTGILLAFTPDGRRLVCAANKRVLIWNMQEAVK